MHKGVFLSLKRNICVFFFLKRNFFFSPKESIGGCDRAKPKMNYNNLTRTKMLDVCG